MFGNIGKHLLDMDEEINKAEEPISSAGRHLDTNRAGRNGNKLFNTDIQQIAPSVKAEAEEQQNPAKSGKGTTAYWTNIKDGIA